MNPRSYTVTTGTVLTLHCFVSEDVDSLHWHMYRDGSYSKLEDMSKYGGGSVAAPSLIINQVNIDDTGRYICKAENSKGSTSSDDVYLTLIEVCI